jgi:hypothetical protein
MKLAKVLFLVWISIWLFLFCRQYLFNPSFLTRYYHLALADAEGRREMSYGSEFYRYLRFCEESLPARSRFQLIGPPDWSLDRVRAHYYLYPHRLSDDPDFLLVYKTPLFRQSETVLYASLDKESFILKVKRD